MGKLDGRVAVVTGAASGIGLAAAKRFGAEGATVVMTDVNRGEFSLAARQLNGTGMFEPFTVDVTRNQDLEALRDRVVATYGCADILVANAGIATFASIGDVSEEAFDRTVATNLKGTFFTVQTLLPALRDGSSIILMSSMVAKKAVPAFSAYSATKAAISALARNFALDLRGRRIRVNAIAPGHVETTIGRHAGLSKAENDDYFARTATLTPLGRNGQADDIAAAALYLASDESVFVTGSEIAVDGGFSLC
jgi:NAD(P)-dependent dehydrogenase (short-subunit alcohol dehydrogenase family)